MNHEHTLEIVTEFIMLTLWKGNACLSWYIAFLLLFM